MSLLQLAMSASRQCEMHIQTLAMIQNVMPHAKHVLRHAMPVSIACKKAYSCMPWQKLLSALKIALACIKKFSECAQACQACLNHAR